MTAETVAEAPRRPTAFAHASEAELARILTYYDVAWEYEPDTFPIGWTLEGDVAESFSPDFYLPELDLYVELTTLKQSLVRKKNRKLRRLRELYPDVRIKLFYARDFRMLLLKFGRHALAGALSGTTGQATPPRPRAGAAGLALEGAGAEGLASAAAPPGPPGSADPADPADPAAAAHLGRRRRPRRRRSAGRAQGRGADAAQRPSPAAAKAAIGAPDLRGCPA